MLKASAGKIRNEEYKLVPECYKEESQKDIIKKIYEFKTDDFQFESQLNLIYNEENKKYLEYYKKEKNHENEDEDKI